MPSRADLIEQEFQPLHGSAMSSRQIAYSAVAGRKVSFFFTQERVRTIGYVVGSDDYHWLVAGRPDDPDDDTVELTLIHKTAAGFITLHPEATLATESDAVQVKVKELGSGFWGFCNSYYFGRKAPESEEGQ